MSRAGELVDFSKPIPASLALDHLINSYHISTVDKKYLRWKLLHGKKIKYLK
jgi:hypothetical protein